MFAGDVDLKTWYKPEIDKKKLKELSKRSDIKGIIDIVTTRIHWKSEELLPVGIVLKQIDELLEKK